MNNAAEKVERDAVKIMVSDDQKELKQEHMKVKEERGRFKSAPGPLDSTDGVEQREERKIAKMIVEAGEDMTDGVVEVKESKKTHEGKRRATLKVICMMMYMYYRCRYFWG